MKRLVMAVVLSIGVSSAAMAKEGRHGERFDWGQLDLTTQQEERIDAIKKDYRSKFHSLRKAEGSETKKQELHQLRQDMNAQVALVLTTEQKQEANTLMIAKMEKRNVKRLNRLTKKLSLTAEQENSVQQVLSARLAEDKAQLESGELITFAGKIKMSKQLDEAMATILSAEQLQQWQKMKEKRQGHIGHK